MIFDVCIFVATTLAFSLVLISAFLMGKAVGKENALEKARAEKNGEGWQGIVNYDHKGKGGGAG